jgi:REP element-mobilizing transposase RayT
MPRGPRLDEYGALHHVMMRGIERREVFHTAADRDDFVDRLAFLARDTGTVIYAWCIMPNHAHLVARSGPGGISSFMARLLTGYAVAFNRRHDRVGHLFQNRFKSLLVGDDPYFLELIRYVHLNPLRDAIVADLAALDRNPWCGHARIVGSIEDGWQDVDGVLEHFGSTRESAIAAYRDFLNDGLRGDEDAIVQGSVVRPTANGLVHASGAARGRERWANAERVLGSPTFLNQLLTQLPLPPGAATPPHRVDDVLTSLIHHVAATHQLDPAELGRAPRARAARALLSHIAVHHYGISLRAIAAALRVSPPTILRALRAATGT